MAFAIKPAVAREMIARALDAGERVVDDISEVRRPRAKHAKDAGSAAVALAGIALGVAWICTLVRLLR